MQHGQWTCLASHNPNGSRAQHDTQSDVGGAGPACDPVETAGSSFIQPSSFLPSDDDYFKPTPGRVFDEEDNETLAGIVNAATGGAFLGMYLGGRGAGSWFAAQRDLGRAISQLTKALTKFNGTPADAKLQFLMAPGLATKSSPSYNLLGWKDHTANELKQLAESGALTADEAGQLTRLVANLDKSGLDFWRLRQQGIKLKEDHEWAAMEAEAARDETRALRYNIDRKEQLKIEAQRPELKNSPYVPSVPAIPTMPAKPVEPARRSLQDTAASLAPTIDSLAPRAVGRHPTGSRYAHRPLDAIIAANVKKIQKWRGDLRQTEAELQALKAQEAQFNLEGGIRSSTSSLKTDQTSLRYLRRELEEYKSRLVGKEGSQRAELESDIQNLEARIHNTMKSMLPAQIAQKERQLAELEGYIQKQELKNHDLAVRLQKGNGDHSTGP